MFRWMIDQLYEDFKRVLTLYCIFTINQLYACDSL